MNCCPGLGEGEVRTTTVDQINAVFTGLKDVVGAVGALATGKQPLAVTADLPGGKRVQVGRDYTPYFVAGAAVLVGAGVLGYVLYKKSKKGALPVASNPRRRSRRRRR